MFRRFCRWLSLYEEIGYEQTRYGESIPWRCRVSHFFVYRLGFWRWT